MRRILLLAALIAIPVTAMAQQDPPAAAERDALTPEQMVDLRQSKMGRGGSTLSRLKQAADAGTDLSTLGEQTRWLADWAEELPRLFAPGTDVAGTDARPEVWSDSAGFAAQAERFRTATRDLAAAAAANDRPAFLAAWTATRATCGSCHEGYKN
ncbi:MAG TPA: cytochrome c [Allosphingosinicella sp.]|nr:cytochrome c [Allosphingosinicella sp.]